MIKVQVSSTNTTVSDPKTGRILTVRGAGALKGRLTIKKGVDLTKPIASQAVKTYRSRKPAAAGKASSSW